MAPATVFTMIWMNTPFKVNKVGLFVDANSTVLGNGYSPRLREGDGYGCGECYGRDDGDGFGDGIDNGFGDGYGIDYDALQNQ